MRRQHLSGITLLAVVGWSVAALAQPVVEGDWVRYETERFFVYLWKDVPPERLPQGSPDPLQAKLDEIATSLEADLRNVENVLRLPYSAQQHGKIAVFIYASLEDYQQKTRCYLCAAHVSALPNTPEVQALAAKLNRYAIYAHLDNTPRGLGGLSIGLPHEVIPHELTHVLDLTLIGGAKPATLREGLAVYASSKSDAVPDDAQFGLTDQHLRLFVEAENPDLMSYLTGCSSRRFIYSFGGSFIDFFAQGLGIERFLKFYGLLQGEGLSLAQCPYGVSFEQLDRLFRQTVGLSLHEVRQRYSARLQSTVITEDGLRSFDFVMDQIFNKVISLKPLLLEGAELERLARAVWAGGRFYADKAVYVTEYISDMRNYTVSAERVAQALKNFDRVRSFASMYIDDPATRSEVELRLRELEQLARQGRYEEFKEGFVNLIFRYMTWRRSPQP
ncbi:MAG: hypothetical protein NZ930_06940 [Candidatus Bipolaricaulota bacterium]|nr:hypothetical protein [Candidatus Bipolaricaulota bacterium]MDW8030654.1 hypothetical protein [Candidatus Bipolaricaulota bacterium]